MERKQSSSSVDNADMDDKEEIDIVTALNTPFQPTAIKLHASTLRKMKEQEEWIKAQQKQIEELTFNLTIKDSHIENLRRDETISHLPSLPTATNGFPETPGPHRLLPKPERPEDIAYRAKLEEQESAEKAMGQQEKSPDSQEALLSVFQSLTKVLKDNNQHLQSSDVTEPTKFNGLDTQWDDFYLQLRTYLEAKGWLTTFDHKDGPGTAGFNTEINKKIYNKLLALCRKGTAATYITKAAASNGWEAGRYLIERYEGFSKQREKSLKTLIETIRHTNGTNMTRHIDKFERICGMMAHNNPTKPPTDEEKVDWFLASVKDRAYDSVHANCTDKQLEGTLTFARVIKFYTHRCFQLYPHFQLDDLHNDKKDLSNNAMTMQNNFQEKGRRRDTGKGKGRGRDRFRNPNRNPNRSHQSRNPENRQKGKGKGKSKKGKSSSNNSTSGDRKPKEPCSYCGMTNHSARTCYKRQNDEKNEKNKTPHQQANLNLQIEETALMFQNSVLSVLHSDPASHTDTTRWGENAQVEETTTDSDQVEDTINEEESDDKEGEVDENNNGESKAFEHIVKTMNHLPDNHYVWGYPDPTNTYYNADKVATEDDGEGQRVDFIHWYDSQLHTMAEFKAIQMIMGYYDEFTAEMEGDEHESQTPLRDEAGPANGAEHGK